VLTRVSDGIQTQERRPLPQELANQRLQELLSLAPSYPHTPQQQSHIQSHPTQSQSRGHATAVPTSPDQPNTSDAHSAPVEYHIQETSFSSASDFVTTQSDPYPRTTEQYYPSARSELDVGITVGLNEPLGTYYNAQASHSISSLVRPIICFFLPPAIALPHLFEPVGDRFRNLLVTVNSGGALYEDLNSSGALLHPFIFRDSRGSSLDSTMPIHWPIRDHIHTHLHTPIFRVLHLQHTQILPRVTPVSHGFVTPSKLPFLFDSYLCTLLSLPLNPLHFWTLEGYFMPPVTFAHWVPLVVHLWQSRLVFSVFVTTIARPSCFGLVSMPPIPIFRVTWGMQNYLWLWLS
jgi:hypothetical protein